MRSQLTFIFVIFLGLANADFLTPPPDLMDREIPEIKAKFATPNSWYYKKSSENPLTVLFTEKPVGLFGCFDTGLRIEVRRHSKEKDPAAFIKSLLDKEILKSEVVKPLETQNNPPVTSHSVILKDKARLRITAHTVMVNHTTKTLYLLSFRGPENRWDELWIRGKFMIGHFSMDDEI